MTEETGSVSESNASSLFDWTIGVDIIEGGEDFSSPDFQFFGCEWYIVVFPRSDLYPGNVDMSLERIYSTPPPPLPVSVRWGVRQADGSVEERGTCTMERDRTSSNIVMLLSHDEVKRRRSELLPSGTLTVTCRMEVAGTGVRRKEDAAVQCRNDAVDVAVQCVESGDIAGLPLETLSSDLEQLLASKEKCDVTLRVTDREFSAHWAVLVARSSVFKAMFHKDTAEEQTGVVEIEDCEPESFGAFLRFLYCGKFDGVTSKNALHLYVAADKYDVRELKEFCLKHMEQNVTVENMCHVVTLADQYDEEDLMKSAQNFFNQNLRNIFQTSEWPKFMVRNHRLANKLLLEMSAQVNP